MPVYAYTAINQDGKDLKGEVEAADQVKALEIIKQKGSFPTSVKEMAAGASQRRLSGASGDATLKEAKPFDLGTLFVNKRVGEKHLVNFMQQFSTLIASGLPVVRSLNILKSQTGHKFLKKVIDDMNEAILAGGSFSDAMQKFPSVFPRLSIDLIKAGETSGAFDVVLARLAGFMEKSRRIKQKVIGALVYPSVVILISMAVVVFLIVFAVPKFTVLFKDLNITLPGPTLFLLALSHFVRSYWYIAIMGIAGVVFGLNRLSKIERVKYYIDAAKLKIPVFGILFQKIAISRFSRTFGVLLSSGVPILSAIAAAREVCGNKVLSGVVSKAYDDIREGELIAQSFSRDNVFPALFVNMIAVGEESGHLDKSLSRISDIYDEDVDTMVSSLASLLEPVLIITLALIVGFIVVSMFLPLIKLLDTLSV
jgi:type IV pilus assembly protein PilC